MLAVKTVYFDETFKVLKINRASHVGNASKRAYAHLHDNDYGAKISQVYDGVTGKLYSEFVRNMVDGGKCKIENTYDDTHPANKDKPTTRRSLAALLVGLDVPPETHF